MTVKHATYAVCNSCSVAAEVEDQNFRPQGWYHVRIPDDNGKLNPTASFDLCSLKCVARWARDRGQAIGQPTHLAGGAYTSFPCPLCDQPVAPQGLANHVRSAHPDEDYVTVKAMYDEQKNGHVHH